MISYGDTEIEVITANNFKAKNATIGLPEFNSLQMQSLMHVLGKPDLEGFICLKELEILLADFGPTEQKPDTPRQKSPLPSPKERRTAVNIIEVHKRADHLL